MDVHLRYLRERQADVTRRLIARARAEARRDPNDCGAQDARPQLRLVRATDVLAPPDGAVGG